MATLAQGVQQEANKAVGQVKVGADNIKHEILSWPSEVHYRVKTNVYKATRALTEFQGSVRAEAAAWVAKVYIWAAVCLIGLCLGEMAGKSVLHGVIETVFRGASPVVMLGVVVPVAVWVGVKFLDDPSGRGASVLLYSIGVGLLVGSVMHGRQMQFVAPSPVVFPLTAALAAYVASTYAAVLLRDRRVFMPVVILPAVAVYIAFGLYQMEKVTTSYVLYFLLLTVIGLIDLQVKIEDHHRGSFTSLQLEQWKTVVVLGIADLIAFWTVSEKIEEDR